MKARVCSIHELVEDTKRKNNGKPSKIVSHNGFKMELTVENYLKLRDQQIKEYDEKKKQDIS